MPTIRSAAITPSAARLTESLRDIGYDFPSAVADLVDNSLMAGAQRVEVTIEFQGADSSVTVADDGCGMTANGLIEALRYGARRTYCRGDLGRYGLGLKTASLSQCRSLTVVTRSTASVNRVCTRRLDLDLIAEWDEWLVVDPGHDRWVQQARSWLSDETGTVVIWNRLDRVLPEKRPDGGWARRRLETLAGKTTEHLGIVFHRFLAGGDGRELVLTVNGQKVDPWDPFAPSEPERMVLPRQVFEVSVSEVRGTVSLQRFVLPSRDQFSSAGEFERLSGPLNWNRQQGLYIYRSGRLVQWGGWNGVRGIDEHTKLARAALDFDTDLDSIFHINVAKMRVTIPPQLRQMIERPINELCGLADSAYRKTPRRADENNTDAGRNRRHPWLSLDQASPQLRDEAGLALRAAAMQAGEYEAFQRIITMLQEQTPEVARNLGLDS